MMAEYIKRDDALRQVLFVETRENMFQHIKDIPAADVWPVVKARWIGYPECLKYTNAYSDDHIVCSACEECFSILDNDCERFNFCPNCGAKMGEPADV
jgi:NADH pyrophosphatase NudC (nudix superfamily)